jgi:hypothetical protein
VAVTNAVDALLYGSGTAEGVATRFGLTSPAVPIQPILPVNTNLLATAAPNWYSTLPQVFNRIRVESGGANKQPFAQEQNTNKMVVTDPTNTNLLEEILVQLIELNENIQTLLP